MDSNTKDIMKRVMMILIIVAVGCLAINQFLGFYYKSDLLKNPCQICKENNPHYEPCFQEQSTTRESAYGKLENKNKIKINLSNINLP